VDLKRERQAVKEKNELSQHGSLNKFFKIETSNDSEYLDKNFISKNSHSHGNNSSANIIIPKNKSTVFESDKYSNSVFSDSNQSENNGAGEENAEVESSNEYSIKINNTVQLDDDIGKWPDIISDAVRIFLVKRGPPNYLKNFDFPLNENGRKFNPIYYHRTMSNNEKILRYWLVYSKSKDKLFCFYCRLFPSTLSTCSNSNLATEGFSD
jgi:hypothetical protein